MPKSIIILAHSEVAEKIVALSKNVPGDRDFSWADSLEILEGHFRSETINLMISFGTSVIVPGWILDKLDLTAVNIHAASPQYPGRDPHHFAVYDGVAQYGATLHFMTQNVDSGPIIDVELFDVPDDVCPIDLQEKSNKAAFKLLEKYLSRFLLGDIPSPNPDLQWSGKKRSRKDFLELCRIDIGISKIEFKRRQRACQMPGYDNLYTVIQGCRFKMETSLEE